MSGAWHLARAGVTAAIFSLSACGGNGGSGEASIDLEDNTRVLSTFSYFEASPPALPPSPALRVEDPGALTLTHIDPLALGPSDIIAMGSDTISPVTAQMIDQFYNEGFAGNFRMSQSSTGAGMRALCSGGDVQLVNASRPMSARERALCVENGVTPVVIQIGYDPFVFMTHRDNTWFNDVMRVRLPGLFRANNWSEIDPSYPDAPITFYLREADSGAVYAMSDFVYGDPDAPDIRNVQRARHYGFELELTRDLAEDPHGIGFSSYGKLVGLSQLNVNVLPIDGAQPISSGSAYPVKRSLYVLTSRHALKRADVQTFLAHYLNAAPDVMPPLGFVPLDGRAAQRQRTAFVAALRAADPENDVISIAQN